MIDTGIQMQLWIGPTVPRPVPADVIDAISSVEVTNNDSGRDGFQISLTLAKDSLVDYGLLLNNYFEPPNRVIIAVMIGARPPQVLIDGIITNHQVAPSNTPGGSTLVVTGEDISLKMDLEDKNKTYANQSDSSIVQTILGRYASDGLVPEVTSTQDTPQQNDRVPTQQGTDLAFVTELARRNGFVFYVEPKTLLVNSAYWGLQDFTSPPQPALSLNLGPDTNVESLSFSFNALGPATPAVTILEPSSRALIPIPVPSALRPPLASQPTVSLRRTLPRNTANLNSAQAAQQALASAAQSADAVTGSGQLNAVRYGSVLRARRLVDVRGVGLSYSGQYYVKQVTHRLKRGEYKQSFSLSREGRGALAPLVTT
jgi:phage protein D